MPSFSGLKIADWLIAVGGIVAGVAVAAWLRHFLVWRASTRHHREADRRAQRDRGPGARK
jgi:hypothetical protein